MIKEFQGEYRFLSNFWFIPNGIEYEGKIYKTVEHAYQAAKFTEETIKEKIRMENFPGTAKRLARQYQIRKDWDDIKVSIMMKLLRKKFSNKELAKKLLETGDQELQEGNTWHDTFWGVDIRTGKGENILGELLKVIRSDLSSKSKSS